MCGGHRVDERREAVPAIEAAVDGAANTLPVSLGGEPADPSVLEVLREDARCDFGLQGKVGILLERQSELLSVVAVVRTAGQLDEAAPVVAGTGAGLCVAEGFAALVHLREVRGAAGLTDRQEGRPLWAGRGDRGDHARSVVEAALCQGLLQSGPVLHHVRLRATATRTDLRRRKGEAAVAARLGRRRVP